MLISTTYTPEEQSRIPLLFMAGGIDHIQEPIKRPNGIEYYQFFCCTRGMGEIMIGGRRGIISKGQGMFLMPHVSHAYQALTSGWRFDFITISGTVCPQILSSLKFTESDVFSYATPDIFRRHMQNCLEIHSSRKRHKNLLLSEECFSLLLEISGKVNRVDDEIFEENGDTVMMAIDYMESNYMNDISLNDIAEAVGLSKEHLCRVFKKNLNETIVDTLTRIRLSHACRQLLQRPNKTALEIGLECGFSSASYFGKVFKQWEGMTPNQYRLNNGR